MTAFLHGPKMAMHPCARGGHRQKQKRCERPSVLQNGLPPARAGGASL